MSPRTLRLVLAFLAGFVTLSFLPALPGLLHGVDLTAAGDRLGDGLPAIAIALLLLLLLGSVSRRRRAAPARVPAPAPRPGRAVARPGPAESTRSRPSSLPRARVTAEPPASPLAKKLQAAARAGERIPALARRHSLSVDAIRVAIDREPSAPAARRGSSFRPRQPAAPADSRSRPLPARPKPYGALA